MKHIRNYITLVALAVIFAACEEVIDIDLNSADPAIVAEGVMEKDNPARIRLSYTSDYFDNEEAETINDAIVTITDSEGNYETLQFQAEGIYIGTELLGLEEGSYTLTFNTQGNEYSAFSELPEQQDILSVEFTENDRVPPGSNGKYGMNISFTDNPETHNYYMLKFFANGAEMDDRYYLIDDAFFASSGTIEYEPRLLTFNLEDHVDVFLYSIDEGTYVYYNQLNDISGNRMGGSSTPYNPGSNFGTEIMGYFAAWSYSSFNITVK